MRTPSLTLALLLTMALGIGGNVSVSGFVRGLTRPNSILTSEGRIISIFSQDVQGQAGPLSYDEYQSLSRQSHAFEWVGTARILPGNVVMANQSAIVSVATITPPLARALHFPLEQGVVISHRLWQNEFGAKADVRGDPIRIDGVDARVSGVAPAGLEGLYRDRAVDLWMRWPEKTRPEAERGRRDLWVLVRLRRNVSISQAQTVVHPNGISGGMRVLPYTGMTPEMAEGLSRVATLLGWAAGVVFFVACANVASFILGRAFTRAHETCLRVALGARRCQLVRELLADSTVLAIAGGICGTLLAVWTSHAVPALLFEQDAERLVFAPDLLAVIAGSAAGVGGMMVCGLLPVFVISESRPAAVLRRESAGPSPAMRRLRVGLVVAQMASSCVLVISTGFLLDGLHTALQTSNGRRLGHPILATVQASPDAGLRYFQDVEQAAQSLPGVSALTWAGRLPGSPPEWQSYRIEPPELPLREVMMDQAWFTADSLHLFALPPTEGRLFGFEDQTCPVSIVNEKAAQQLFGRSTVGRTVQGPAGPPVTIIGVVAMRKALHAALGSHRSTIYYQHGDQTGLAPDRIASVRFRVPIASELARAELDANVVSTNYFETVGASLTAGQTFPLQRAPGGCRVSVVNQEAADLFFDGQAVGSAVIDEQGRRTEIIGVVRSAPLGAFQRQAEPAIYFPMAQDGLRRMTLMVGIREKKGPPLADLQRKIESVPGRGRVPVVVKTLETHLAQTALAPLRIATLLIGASAAAALVLSVLGLLGALSDAARQRRRELAIRIALGAQRWRVIGQVLKEGGRLTCVGTIAGMLGSLFLSRGLTRIAQGHGSSTIWVWLAAPLILGAAVVMASVLPARRALLVNPVTILRDDP